MIMAYTLIRTVAQKGLAPLSRFVLDFSIMHNFAIRCLPRVVSPLSMQDNAEAEDSLKSPRVFHKRSNHDHTVGATLENLEKVLL